MKCLACSTKVQLGMYSASSHGLVPWELLSLLLVPWERGKFKTEVFSVPQRSAGGHIYTLAMA